jgi:bifunctional UDP-N-acetylglucosamine pyrophosphorylase/glucosamine-1-phosphate N-acetyltransferase
LGARAQYVVQEQRLGTGHATLVARDLLERQATQVLVTYGDMPLLQSQTMAALAQRQAQTGAAIVVLTVLGDPQSSFGRVLRDEEGYVTEIVEVAQASRRQDGEAVLATRELNVGVYCFDAAWLWDNLPHLPLRQARSGPEYYLTDMVELAVAQNRTVEAVVVEDADEGLGAGTRAELVDVERALRRRINRYWMENGVTLVDPESTYIDEGVQIGQDTVIWPNSFLQGRTVVGDDCVIGPNSILRDATVGDGCRVEQTVVEGVTLGRGEVVEPGSHLRKSAAERASEATRGSGDGAAERKN